MSPHALVRVVVVGQEVVRSNGTPGLVRATQGRAQVVRAGVPGPAGPPGPPGQQQLYPAGQTLSGHRVVCLRDGVLRYPDLFRPADAYALVGLTTGAALAGEQVAPALRQVVEEPSWSWTPDALIYVGPSGVLTATPPAQGWLCIVGVAQSPTRLLVAPREPIMRLE